MTPDERATNGRDPRAVPPLEPLRIRLAYRAYVRARINAHRLRRVGRSVDTGWRGVRILLYHRVADTAGDPLAITPRRFRRQLEYVKSLGIPVIPLREVHDVLERGDGARAIAITLDDGYRDALTAAEPILRDLELPATVFLPTGIVSGRERCTWYEAPPPFLSWEDIAPLTASGFVEVQPHGVGHFALPNLDGEESRAEVLGSIEELRDRAGVESHTFSFPAGLYGPRELEIVAESSLRGAVTCDAGVNDAATPRETLRRTAVLGVETLREFSAVLGGALDDSSRFAGRARMVRRLLLPAR
jgi:peptidoglycan/xylan/chitin deacetylase (PgdA/CDA1 family)